jgi:general secretion pathway protein G
VRRCRRAAGFTLMELLLVVLIISVLAAIVAPNILSKGKEARIAATKQQIVNLEGALKLYYLDNDVYPTTDQGLASLVAQPTGEPMPSNWKGPYLEHGVPNDPWKNPYIFTSPGVQNPDSFDILSYGPDGKEGGGDDIANYEVTQ